MGRAFAFWSNRSGPWRLLVAPNGGAFRALAIQGRAGADYAVPESAADLLARRQAPADPVRPADRARTTSSSRWPTCAPARRRRSSCRAAQPPVWSPDGLLVACAGSAGQVAVADLAGHLRFRIPGRSPFWSHDGRLAVSDGKRTRVVSARGTPIDTPRRRRARLVARRPAARAHAPRDAPARATRQRCRSSHRLPPRRRHDLLRRVHARRARHLVRRRHGRARAATAGGWPRPSAGGGLLRAMVTGRTPLSLRQRRRDRDHAAHRRPPRQWCARDRPVAVRRPRAELGGLARRRQRRALRRQRARPRRPLDDAGRRQRPAAPDPHRAAHLGAGVEQRWHEAGLRHLEDEGRPLRLLRWRRGGRGRGRPQARARARR